MIRLNKNLLTVAAAAIFAITALFLSSPIASMQAGANTIVFDRYDNELGQTKIFVMNADGSNPIDLGPGNSPSWSPDGTKIVFADGNGETSDLWTMNADGTDKTRLTENFSSHSPAWSPSGDRIAFVSQHEGGMHLYLINADGQDQVRLAVADSSLIQEAAPLWSPDGTKVLFQGTRVTPAGTRDDYYQADASNSGATQRLTFVDGSFDSGKATISPDGAKLVARHQHDLHVFALDGSQTVTNLTADMAESPYDPDFAPGGSRIVFVKGNYLATMRPDGSDVVSLDVVGDRPDWNPTAVIVEPTPTPTATPQVTIDLSLQASAAPATVQIGGQTTFTVTVNNPSQNPASGVQLTAPIAAALSIGKMNAGQGSCSVVNSNIECALGTVAANSSVTVTIAATVNAAGLTVTNFTVAAAENDPDLNNNTQLAGVTATASTPCAAPLVEQIEMRDNGQWYRDERTGIDVLRTTIRNRSGRTLDPRVMFVITIQTPGVTVEPSAIAGYTQCTTPNGLPYLVAYAPNKKEWKPNQDITVRIPFVNPGRGGIEWSWAWYSGRLNP